ncbi:MAG: serine protease [Nitrosopumilales archaeon]|nr:MAG: serine protease [Nitrosopumilales archaeon]
MSYTQFVSAQISTLENSTAQDPLSLPDLFTKVEKSVVQVTEVDNSNELGSRLGSGFVYDNNGHVITNYHVVSQVRTIIMTSCKLLSWMVMFILQIS